MRRLLALLLLLVVLAGAWVGVRGYLAYGHARDAVDRLPTFQQQVTGVDTEGARHTLTLVQDDTAAAHRLTSDPVWGLVAAFPFGGQNLEAFAAAAAATDGVAQDGLPALVDAAEGLGEFSSGLQAGDLDGAALAEAGASVQRLDASLQDARTRLDGIDRRFLLPQVEQALTELEQALDVATQVREQLAELVPAG